MAWTTPRTWVAGELETAAIMNSAIRDNLNILKTSINDDGSLKTFHKYTVTMTDVVNVSVETDFISVTIPAGDWGDGEYIVIRGYVLHKNNKGSAGTLSPKIYVQGVTVASIPPNNTSFTSSINEAKLAFGLILQREGANVFYQDYGSGATQVLLAALTLGDLGVGDWALLGPPGKLPWTPNFANAIIIKESATPSAADPAFYVKPRGFIAHKFGS